MKSTSIYSLSSIKINNLFKILLLKLSLTSAFAAADGLNLMPDYDEDCFDLRMFLHKLNEVNNRKANEQRNNNEFYESATRPEYVEVKDDWLNFVQESQNLLSNVSSYKKEATYNWRNYIRSL